MGEGFDHLRCPMCGGELIYSEGTHDLCCARNPYESMSGEEWEAGAALHEGRAGYGEGAGESEAGRLYIYKVWNEGEEGGRLKHKVVAEPAPIHAYSPGISPSPLPSPLAHLGGGSRNREGEGIRITDDADSAAEASAGETHTGNPSAAPVKGHVSREAAGERRGIEGYAGGADNAQASDTPVKGHACVFAVSFTESGRFGTLWSMRTVHAEANYFSLTRLMQKIEKRLRNGEPLAANAPNPPKKRERSAAAKLAFRFGIEEEDVYSIRFSTETVKRLALFYGISERDVRRIRQAEIGEE